MQTGFVHSKKTARNITFWLKWLQSRHTQFKTAMRRGTHANSDRLVWKIWSTNDPSGHLCHQYVAALFPPARRNAKRETGGNHACHGEKDRLHHDAQRMQLQDLAVWESVSVKAHHSLHRLQINRLPFPHSWWWHKRLFEDGSEIILTYTVRRRKKKHFKHLTHGAVTNRKQRRPVHAPTCASNWMIWRKRKISERVRRQGTTDHAPKFMLLPPEGRGCQYVKCSRH